MSLENKIIKMIESNEEIKRYRELEKEVNNNKNIKHQMSKLKKLQKQIVHAKEYKKPELLKKLETDYAKLYDSIIESPIMAEYMDLQVKIDTFLIDFSEIIETGINSDLSPKTHENGGIQ